MSKTFRIPVSWELFALIEVEADSLEEAIEHFDKHEEEVGYELPTDESEYVDGSFQRGDEEYVKAFNTEPKNYGNTNETVSTNG